VKKFSRKVLEARLEESIRRHRVPGAQLAVLQGDAVTEVAAGVLSLRTRQPVTTDALFLPGSIGKLYTATMVMSLVEQGKVDLDAPIRTYLRDFQTADPAAASSVTVRNLLSHTSGFDGDHFADTGRGDDALARYVEGCTALPQICAPGTAWSYSNTGYGILGRIAEVVTGQVFEEVLRDRVLDPLGVRHTVLFPEDVLTHPAAIGHVPDPAHPRRHIVTPQWGMHRSLGPMGASIVASAGDVMEFLRMHLRGGTAAGGRRILKANTVRAMQVQQVSLLDPTLGEGWGLGWILDHWGGIPVVGHDGNSLGQNAFARVAPGPGFGFCLQTNVESAVSMYRELAAWLFEGALGVTPHPAPRPGRVRAVADQGRFAGNYRREGIDILVSPVSGGALVASVSVTRKDASTASLPPMQGLPLKPVGGDVFLLKLPIADEALSAIFFNPDGAGARPTFLHFGGRASRRVDE
ncbi:MAG: beta-lactamase family protein, partial [Candidatus Dormibacteraeota bacterium]|nr:beta-lactamase family protein [Candidatus Dormibacteraeota bacterium]